MSDTPRCAAMIGRVENARCVVDGRTLFAVEYSFAQQLERELTAMTALWRTAHAAWELMTFDRDGYATRCAELESALRDAMRGAQ